MTLRVGDSGDDVQELQTQLQSAGYYSGPIDGQFGPDTEEAVRAYQSAHGLSVDGVVGAETWGNIHGDPNYPNNSAGTLGGSSPGASSADEKVRQNLPQYAYLLDNPEVGDLLRRAYGGDTPMDAGRFQVELMATNWWKTNSDTARDYYNLQNTDPATFQRKVWEFEDQIYNYGGELGYDETILTPQYVRYFAEKAMREGLNPSQIKNMLASEITPAAGTTEKSPILHQLREIQQAYQVAIDPATQNYWLQVIGSGRMTIDNFRGAIIAQAKALFPHLTGQFEQGLSLKDIIRPYRRQIADMLEINEEDIDVIGNPKWREVVDYVDPKDGVHRMMSMQEMGRYVRGMDEYWDTRQGKDDAGGLAEEILTSFGAVRR